MKELQKKIKTILEEIENKYKNEDDALFAKTKVLELYDVFADELENLENEWNDKVDIIATKHALLESKVQEVQNALNKIKANKPQSDISLLEFAPIIRIIESKLLGPDDFHDLHMFKMTLTDLGKKDCLLAENYKLFRDVSLALSDQELDFEGLEAFSLNEENELKQAIINNNNKKNIYLYKIKLLKGINFIAFSNIVLYNNKNMTLPVGMRESNRILIDTSELDIKPVEVKKINIEFLENNKDDFSKIVLKKIKIYET